MGIGQGGIYGIGDGPFLMTEKDTPSNPPANQAKLYVKDDGAGTTRVYLLDSAGIETDLTGGGGGAMYLPALLDVDDALDFTDGYVLVMDGEKMTSRPLVLADISDWTELDLADIEAHLEATDNPHSVTAAQAGAVALTGNEEVAGIKTFTSIPVLPASNPTADNQAVRKAYVDAIASGLTWKAPVLDVDTLNPSGLSPETGQRYLILGTGAGEWSDKDNNIAEYDTDHWVYTAPDDGYALIAIDDGKQYVYSGDAWVQYGATTAYTASLGAKLDGLDIQADLSASGAIILDGDHLMVSVDDSSIEIDTNALQVKAAGITNAMLAGSIADSKLNKIDTAGKLSGKALTELANTPSGAGVIPIANLATGTPTGAKFIRDDGTLAVPEGSGGGGTPVTQVYIPLYFTAMSSTALNGGIWTNMPSAETVLYGSATKGVRKFDASGATKYRITVVQTVQGYAGADIRLQYSLDGSTGWTNADAGGTELDVGTGTGVKATALVDLAEAAKANVWFRLLGKQGNGSADPAWSEIKVEFLYDVGTDIDAATTDAAGIVELATDAETAAGTDTERAVTPAGLASVYQYQTIYVPASAMTPATTNGAAAGSYESSSNKLNVDYLAFDGATEEMAHFQLPFPEGWNLGTIKAKFYWSSATGSTAGDTVEWELACVAIGNDGALDAALGTSQVISDTLLADNGADMQITAATPALTVGGTPALGKMVHCRVSRNVGGTDDMTEDARLFGCWIQYKVTNTVSAW